MRRSRLTDLPLIIKMGAAPAAAVIMLLVLAIVTAVVQGRQSTELRNIVQTEMPHSLRMQKIAERITAVNGQLYLLLTHKAGAMDEAKIPGQMDALLADIDGISKDLKSERAIAPADQRPAFDRVLKDLADCRSSIEAVGAILTADFATAAGFVAPFEGQYGVMSAELNKLVGQAVAKTQQTGLESYNAAKASEIAMISAALLTLVMVTGLALASVLPLRRAITRIAGATESLAQGQTEVNLEALTRRDELGAIVRSLTVFRDNQLHLAELRQQQEAAARTSEAERARNDESRAEVARAQQHVVESLAGGLTKLSEGDLTYRLTQEFPDEYKKLQDDFNAAMSQMQEAMKVIAVNADGMLAGTGEISQAADDLSRRTEHQAATLEQTAAAVDQITATVKRTAEGAGQANAVVPTAKGDAEKSGQVVRQAVAAMTGIEKSSHEISQIIGVIDEIAFQTNLLALNAGVEAARAGDAGKGFAVVASEVRALAQRSAEAAKEIKGLISTSTQQVKEGVNLVGQTGETLERIVGQVAQITSLVSEIAASAQEQSTGLAEVNTAVNQMDQSTQQNAAMVEQSTAASHALAQEARQLVQLVARFRIGDRVAETGESRSRARLSEARPGTHAPGANPVADARARLASFAGSNSPAPRARAAAAGKSQPQSDGWEEF